MKTFLFFNLLALLIVGCSTTENARIWHQTGISQEQANRDLAACRLYFSETHIQPTSFAEMRNYIANCMEAKGYVLTDSKLANQSSVYIKVDAFQKFPPLNGKTFIICPLDKELNNDLEFQTYADTLAQGLTAHDLVRVQNTNCDFVVFLRYKFVPASTKTLGHFSVRVDIDNNASLVSGVSSSICEATIDVGSYGNLPASTAYICALKKFSATFPFNENPFHREFTEPISP